MKNQRIEELKQSIRNAEKEKHKLEKELNEELLPQYAGKYYKHKSGYYFIKVCKYNEKEKQLECWSINVEHDWNYNDVFTTEYLIFTNYQSFIDFTEITPEEFETAVNEYLSSMKHVLLERGE